MVWLRRAALAVASAIGVCAVAIANLSAVPAAAAWNSSPQTFTTDQAMTYQINPAHSGSTGPETLALPLQGRWSVDLGGPVSYALMGPAYIYVTVLNPTTAHTALYALNYGSGATAWGPIDLGASRWANASYDNGLVFTVNGNGQMQAFDEQTGAVQWTTQLPGQWSFSSPPTSSVFESGSDLIYTSGAGSGGTLYAVHATTGAIAWQAAVMNGDHSAPVVTTSGVYVSYACAQTYAFEPLHGAQLWHHSTYCEGGGGRTAALYNGKLYVRDAIVGNTILDADTGASLGTFAATAAPAFSGSTGFFLNGSTLSAVNLSTNATVWTFTGDGTLDTAPIAINGNVYVGASSGNLYAVDASSGAQTWSAHLSSPIGAPDEQNTSAPLVGLSAGGGYLAVPAGNTLTLFGGALQVVPGSINFSVKSLSSATTVQVGITDNFGGAVTVSGVSVTGDYSLSSNGCTALVNGQQCQIAVTFSPTAYGQRNGTLTIDDNAAGGPHSIALIGEASDMVADHLVLHPSTVTMVAGSSQGFVADAYDAYGNYVGNYTPQVTFSMTGGSCTANVCTSTQAGGTTAAAQYSGSKPAGGQAAVTVAPGPLARIAVSPSPSAITAGSSQAFTVQALDQYGNSLGDQTTNSTFTIAPDGSCAGATCTATVAGTHRVVATYNSVSATDLMTVNAGPLASLTLSGSSASVTAGSSAAYSASGADQYGNSLGDVTATTSFSIAPDGSCNGTTCTATVAGPHTITGSNSGKTATTTLTVSGAALDHIAIAPASATITAGASQAYTTEGFDQYGNDLGSATGASSFAIAPDGSCAAASCSASLAGSHTVTASDSGKTATATLSVTPGSASTLSITPASASVSAGGTVTYTATATDSNGNSLGDVTASTTFSVAPDGSCSGRFCGSTKAGPHSVTATYQGLTGTASMTVTPAPVTNLILAPSSATIVAGGSQSYTATAYDQYGNSFGDVTSATTFYVDSTLNAPCSGNTCSTTAAGQHHVVGEWNTAAGSSPLTVTAGPLDHITLSPSSAAIAAGGNQTYVVEAYDQYSNDLGNQTSESILAIAPDGSCSGSSCGATKAGAHTVTATDNGKTATASLTVNAGALDHITITPATATISAGGSQAYAVEGFDAYGNDLGSLTANSAFAIAPDGSCNNAACSATKVGAHTVTATSQGKTASASVTVNAGPLASVTIIPASVSLAVKQSQAFTASASDGYGNPLSATSATWSLSTGAPGTISQTSGTATTFKAADSNTGTATLKVTVSGVSGTASITVVPAAPGNLTATVKTTKVTLNWQSASGAKTYAVYRGTSSTSLVLVKPGLTGNSYTDTPGSGTFYYYLVAVGSTGLQSSPSNTVRATLK